MLVNVYVDASFRGRRDEATGITAMLVTDGHVRGRATLGVMARDSHHAESLAIVLGFSLSLLVPNAKRVILFTDCQPLVVQIARSRPRVIQEIKDIISQLHTKSVETQVLYASDKENTYMSHVDYLSKSITTE